MPLQYITIMLTRNRFGWVNASYVYGLTLVSVHMRRALGILTPWDKFKKATEVKLDGFDNDHAIEEDVEEPVAEDSTAAV